MTAVRAVRPDVAEKAQEMLNNYSSDKEGLQKLVRDAGGRAFLDKAADFASSAPRVKAMFQKFGVNPHALKNEVIKNLNNNSNNPSPIKSEKPINVAGDYKDRLSKLK